MKRSAWLIYEKSAYNKSACNKKICVICFFFSCITLHDTVSIINREGDGVGGVERTFL